MSLVTATIESMTPVRTGKLSDELAGKVGKRSRIVNQSRGRVVMRSRFGAVAVVLLGLGLCGCGGNKDSITPTVASRELSAPEIDGNPLALLPGSLVGFARIEAQPTFQTAFGPSLAALARQLAPLPASAGFVIERDLERVFIGAYSMAGADLAGVAIGRFDENQIRMAAQSSNAPGQAPKAGTLVQSLYAGKTVYTVNNMGFCLLTARTALFGNETGIRRALDRIREGRAVNRLPSWTRDLLDEKQAPIGFGVDLRATALSESVSKQVPFVEGLVAARVRGNYAAPGLNLVGSLGYPTPEAAATGAQRVNQTRDLLSQAGFLMSLFGVAQPLERLEAKPNGTEVDFVAAANGTTLGRLITQMTPTILAAAQSGLLQSPAR